jgi:hypothetical protein
MATIAAVGALGASAAPTATPPCKGANLTSSFTVVRNSAGAGNIVYTLRLWNKADTTCFVTGIPGVTLLGKYGKVLPTHASPVFPGALSAIMVTLAPGKSAKATARFSPDVPGPGEQTLGRCEPIAYKLRVAPSGGGTLIAPIEPATSVCEHGTMKFMALGPG